MKAKRTTKHCSTCREDKCPDEFYRNKNAPDGHAWQCKACAKKASQEHYRKNKPKCLDYAHTYRILHKEERKRYNATIGARTRKHLYFCHHKTQYNVHQMANYHLGNGDNKPDYCALCGTGRPELMHHHDYLKPLEVDWLCRPCHSLVHRVLRAVKKPLAELIANQAGVVKVARA